MPATRRIVDYFVSLDDAGQFVSLQVRSRITMPAVFTDGSDLVENEAETFVRADLDPADATALDAFFAKVEALINARRPLAP